MGAHLIRNSISTEAVEVEVKIDPIAKMRQTMGVRLAELTSLCLVEKKKNELLADLETLHKKLHQCQCENTYRKALLLVDDHFTATEIYNKLPELMTVFK